MGSSNYRPSAPFLYEVASHVKNCHFGNYYYLLGVWYHISRCGTKHRKSHKFKRVTFENIRRAMNRSLKNADFEEASDLLVLKYIYQVAVIHFPHRALHVQLEFTLQ